MKGKVGPDVGRSGYSRACYDAALFYKGLDGSCRHQNRVKGMAVYLFSRLAFELSHR